MMKSAKLWDWKDSAKIVGPLADARINSDNLLKKRGNELESWRADLLFYAKPNI